MTLEISSTKGAGVPPTTARASGLSSDFETFLKMLTVQMQNQDPLNPVDSSDYAVQLATFSGVEQQVRTNTLLEQMGAGSAAGLGGYAGWLGQEALAPAPVTWDGVPQTIFTEVAAEAERAELVVLDASGKEVQRQAMALESGAIDWVGSEGGNALPFGEYDLYVASYRGDTLLEFTQARTYNRVTEVRTEDDAVIVTFANGGTVEASEISGLRD